MKEIVIEVRDNHLSIQGQNIQTEKEQAKKVLQNALAALDKKPDFEAKHEITFDHDKK